MPLGISYIKIAKIDGDGNDNINSLQSITKFIVPYSDLGNITYNILNRTERENYFLYQVSLSPQLTTASGSVDYAFTGSVNTSTTQISGSKINSFIPITASYDPIQLLKSGPASTLNYDIGSSITDPVIGGRAPINSWSLPTYTQKDIKIIITGSLTIDNAGGGGGYNGIVNPKLQITNGVSTDDAIEELDLSNVGPGASSTYNFELTHSITEKTGMGSLYNLLLFTQKGGSDRLSASYSFSNASFYVTSSAAGGTEFDNIIEPYFTSNFSRMFDCQPTFNNINQIRPNNFLQAVDYATSTTIPVNYLPIASGSATRGNVPESFFTQRSSITPRYLGAKNQSKEINKFIPIKEKVTDFSQSFNIGNYGKTSPIESPSTTIYEFEWGGGTTPEIFGWGAYKMGRILNVYTTDEVQTLNPGVGVENSIKKAPFQDNWNYNYNHVATGGGFIPTQSWNREFTSSISEYSITLEGNNPINNEISIFGYTDGGVIGEDSPVSTKVLTSEFGVPSTSEWFVPSNLTSGYGQGIVAGMDFIGAINAYATSSYLQLAHSKKISKTSRNSAGAYVTGSLYKTAQEVFNTGDISGSISISESLNQGNRWFITFYNNAETPLDNNNITPNTYGYSGSEDEKNYPLACKGVFEIKSITGSASFSVAYLYPQTRLSDFVGGATDVGYLIWKARTDTPFVIIQDEVGSTGRGCFVDKYTTDEVIQNLDPITKNFGTNKI
jgi:hypothetical protein